MSRNNLARYIWLIDTIRRYGAISREQIGQLWAKSQFSDGSPMPRRTFYNYRNAIEELFNINIECNPSTYEYYIDTNNSHQASVTDWLLNSATMSNVLSTLHDVSDRVFVEDVPSARLYLSQVISALREHRQLHFIYRPYTRINPTRDVVIEPYFMKIFRQRWYVTGLNLRDNQIKTYALDRMADVVIGTDTFEIPADFDSDSFVRDSFGIVFTQAEPHEVIIRANPRRAKYLRALPLHHSQREEIHDDYSNFFYRLRLTPDLVAELLSLGPDVKVMAPAELRIMVTNALRDALGQYE
ncbi:MAG: WYL domain-containing protein [Staphylococcus sp.]|nr:WYL domain-containing protein [Staphylococcus sp.]